MSDILTRAHTWIVGRDTGISSMNIWAHMLGVKIGGWRDGTGPSDPDDLGRCLRLLEIIPEWAPRMPEMAKVSTEWRRNAKHWVRLSEMMAEEVGIHWEKARSAPKTYAAMKRVQAGGKP